MIIDDLYLVSIAIFELKTESILVIDANAVLPLTLASQTFQTVSRRGSQIV